MPAKNEGPSNPGSEATVLVGIFLGCLMVWLLWTFATAWIVKPTFLIDWLELKAISMVSAPSEEARGNMARIWGHFSGQYEASDMTWLEYSRVTSQVGEASKYYVAGAIALLGVLVIFRMKGDGFKAHYDLPKLMLYQSRHWRTLATSARFNPDTAGPEWRPARTGFELLKENDIYAKGGKLNRDDCARYYRSELGSPWHGVKELPIHSQCIALVCGVHALTDMEKVALPFRQEIAVAFSEIMEPEKRKARLEELIQPWMANAKVLKYIDKWGQGHAYVNTAMIRILTESRKESGVLASAEFLWLKGLDRHLWYALNNCGRRAYHFEGAGCVAHYDCENIGRSPLLEPNVEAAVEGMQQYLNDHGTDPDTVLAQPEED